MCKEKKSAEMPIIETENYKFFSHRECECFPCHDVKNTDDFNCLFCYCPLYALGDKCGGNFEYLENGVKSCSECMIPHSRDAFDYIISRCSDIIDLARK
ncbi:MAG: cysteine-rich small domain-containing protein [Bacillota bacterium]|nr:cysteine-rich small domain-containing protein [Bacillota bacterium]